MRFKPLQFVVRVIYPSPKVSPSKPKWISFVLGSGLAISEVLPFVDNQYNGVLHAIKKIKEEWEQAN